MIPSPVVVVALLLLAEPLQEARSLTADPPHACAACDERVLATWHVPEGQNPEPEGLSEVLRAMSEEILEVSLLDDQETGIDTNA